MNAINSVKKFFVDIAENLHKTATKVEGIEKVTKFAQSIFKAVDAGIKSAIFMDASIAENHKIAKLSGINTTLLGVTGGIVDVNDLFCGPIAGIKEIVEIMRGKKKLKPLELVAKCFILPVQVVLSPVCVLVKWGILGLGALSKKNYAFSIFKIPMTPVALVKDLLAAGYSVVSSISNGLKLNQLERKYRFVSHPEFNSIRLAKLKRDLYLGVHPDELAAKATEFREIYACRSGMGYAKTGDEVAAKLNSLINRTYFPRSLEGHNREKIFRSVDQETQEVDLKEEQIGGFLRGNVKRAKKLQLQVAHDINLHGHKLAQDVLKTAVIATGIASAIIGTAFFGLGLILSLATCALAIGLGYAAYRGFLLKEVKPIAVNPVLVELS